jgi:hypothetical protein
MHEIGPKLNYIKAEVKPQTEEFKTALENAASYYFVKEYAFQNSKEEVVKGAVSLLSGYDIDVSF